MVDSGELSGQPGHYRLGTRRDRSPFRPRCGRCWRPASTACRARTSTSCRRSPPSARSPTVGLLERVSGMPADELRKSLRRLEMAGLLVERTDREQLAYEFRHSLTQAVCLRHAAARAAAGTAPRHPDGAAATATSSTSSRGTRCRARRGTRRSPTCAKPAASPRSSAASRPSAISSVRSTWWNAFRHRALARNRVRPALRPAQRARPARAAPAAAGESCRRPCGLAEKLGDERRLAQVHSFLSNYYGNVGHSDLALEAGERSLHPGRARRVPSIC